MFTWPTKSTYITYWEPERKSEKVTHMQKTERHKERDHYQGKSQDCPPDHSKSLSLLHATKNDAPEESAYVPTTISATLVTHCLGDRWAGLCILGSVDVCWRHVLPHGETGEANQGHHQLACRAASWGSWGQGHGEGRSWHHWWMGKEAWRRRHCHGFHLLLQALFLGLQPLLLIPQLILLCLYIVFEGRIGSSVHTLNLRVSNFNKHSQGTRWIFFCTSA